MNMRKLIAIGALAVTAGVGAAAQGGVRMVPRQAQGVRFIEPWRPNGSGLETRIVGTVIDIRQVPVARARVMARNITTGVIAQETESNENGEYAFNIAEPGTYVVEMVMVDGYVVALSNAGSLSRYQTMATVIQLPGRWDQNRAVVIVPQSVTNFVGLSAQNTMTNTTIQIAVDANVAATDPGVPVSP